MSAFRAIKRFDPLGKVEMTARRYARLHCSRHPRVGRVRLWCATFAVAITLGSAASAWAGAFQAEDATAKELIGYLEHEQWKMRLEALEEIAVRKLVYAIDKVVELGKEDMHDKVRLEALEVLADMESSWLVPTAEHMVVEDPVEDNREEALAVIESKSEGSGSAMVLGAVIARDKKSAMRESAAQLLRKKGWVGAEEQLASAALRDGDSDVRRECRRALAVLGGAKYRPVLHRILLDEPNKKYRLEVAALLEDAPLSVDRDPLVGALDDPYNKIAIVAAKGLARLGDKSVVTILREKALETRDRSIAKGFNEAAAVLEG